MTCIGDRLLENKMTKVEQAIMELAGHLEIRNPLIRGDGDLSLY
jgi:hypothetical protein